MRTETGYIEPSAMFGYWRSGSQYVEVHADPPTPEEARPFHVLVIGKSLIPLSALVFARDAAHASHRVLASVRECMERGYRRTPDKHMETDDRERRMGQELFDKLASGEWAIHAKPYDVQQIAAKVIWASNGGYF